MNMNKMNMKYVGTFITVFGLILFSLGTLSILGYVNLQIIDTTPPKILYTFPQNGALYKPSEINEVVVYAQEPESSITESFYIDTYSSSFIALRKTPYTQLSHQMIIIYENMTCLFPDVNFDGIINDDDVNILKSFYGVKAGEPRYNRYLDVYPDGIIDMEDTLLAGYYYGTAVYSYVINTSYPSGKLSFSFSVINSFGLSECYEGVCNIEDYVLLRGYWKINDVIVNTSSSIRIKSNKITVSFVCEDKTVPESSISVKITVNDAIYYLNKVEQYKWSKTIDLTSEINNLILEASTTSSINKITVTIIVEQNIYKFSLEHFLVIAGILMFILGITILYKHRKGEFIYE